MAIKMVFFSEKRISNTAKNNLKLNETDIIELGYLCKPEWKKFILAGICHTVSSAILMLLPKSIPEIGKL
jgi:hypothetical protein